MSSFEGKGSESGRKDRFRRSSGPRNVRKRNERKFAYESHTSCRKKGFVPGAEVFAGNVRSHSQSPWSHDLPRFVQPVQPGQFTDESRAPDRQKRRKPRFMRLSALSLFSQQMIRVLFRHGAPAADFLRKGNGHSVL